VPDYQPSASDFLPLERSDSADRIDRPSLSYWQDVWQRLKTNRRALASLFIVIALLLFTLAGPLLWQVNPAQQDLDQISQAPNLGLEALVVEDYPRVQILDAGNIPRQSAPAEKLAVPGKLRILGAAHSEGVHLAWDAVPGATAYQLYRHELKPSGPDDLGLPLITVPASNLSYRDRLGLQAIQYYYSVYPCPGRRSLQTTPPCRFLSARQSGFPRRFTGGCWTARTPPMSAAR
jgi:hypothetical protein